MKPSTPARPIEKNVVLVGAGNAHLVFVKRFGMQPIPGVAVTLVSEFGVIPYSAMTPGHIGGEYAWEQITVDLVRLCATMGVRFVAERVQRIDPATRKVIFEQRAPLAYDAVSLGLGSLPACPPHMPPSDTSLLMRPMGPFLKQLDALAERLQRSPQALHFVVVGGGVSGCELALAVQKRLGHHAGFRMTLLQGNGRILPRFPAKAAHAFQEALASRGVQVRVQSRVTDSEPGSLVLENGERLAFDVVLWATNASPPRLLRDTGLELNEGGFLRVRDTLQSVNDPAVFGTGDCVSFVSRPDLPRNGVYAVRQGAVLFENVPAFLQEKPLQPFRPQRFTLTLMNTADGEAVLAYGPFAAKGRAARKLKDVIDLAWMRKFTEFPAMEAPAAEDGTESPLMRCGGCGSKISSDVLSAVLKRIDMPDDPRVLLGCRAGEDAAVHRFRPELFGDEPGKMVEVQTVDFFKAFVDDPFLFGRIAALHSLSDLHAMNAKPFSALAIATLPHARGPVQEAQLYELLSGAIRTFREVGVVLTGGHTTEGNELALGFAVTGHAVEDRLFQKGKIQPGDVLVLTKPLGTGALLAAWMRGQCRARWFEKLIASMLLSNAGAGAIFASAGVTGCTDVTGFGLAGHMLEMLDAGRVSVRVDPARVPLAEGLTEVMASGILSTLQRDNAKVACRVLGTAPPWLFDPQTSGGLLAAVKPALVDETIGRLREAGYVHSAAIGEVLSMEADGAPFIHLESGLPCSVEAAGVRNGA